MRLLPLLAIAGCVATAQEPCLDVVTLADGTEMRGWLDQASDGSFAMTLPSGTVVEVPMEKMVGIETCPTPAPRPDAAAPEPALAVPAPTPAPATPPQPAPTTTAPPPQPAPPPMRTASRLPSERGFYAEDRPGLHVGIEANLIGAALRLDYAVNHNSIGRVGLRVGAGMAIGGSSSFSYGGLNTFAQLTVTFGSRGPVRLEAHSGPALPLSGGLYSLHWTAGGAMHLRGKHAGIRLGMTGGFALADPYYLLWQPEAGLLLEF